MPSAEVTPRQKPKEPEPLWPEIGMPLLTFGSLDLFKSKVFSILEWSHGAGTTATRCVTFSDGTQVE